MKAKSLLVVFTAFAAGARAEQILDIFVNEGERIPFLTLQRAETVASSLFARADFRVKWHGAARADWKGINRVIIIKLELDEPTACRPIALGYSLPFEGVHVSICYDRIRGMQQRSLEGVLLGYAMAHEITHLLQRVSRHSTTGIMKPYWDSGDFLRMKRLQLGFAGEDIRLIRDAINHGP